MDRLAVRENAANGCVEGVSMGTDEKFASVRALIAEHNSAIGEGKPGTIDIEKFISNVKLAGGTNDDRLKRMSYEDILACFWDMPGFEGHVKPVALAKDIASVFRGREESTKSVSPKRVATMSPRELVEAFDPTDSDSPVAKRLRELSKGEKFVVYSAGRTVDVGTTLKLLDEVRQGFKGRSSIIVGGEVKAVFDIGDLPDAFVDENPLYPGRPLRPDGTCDQTGRSWDGIPLKIRQLVWVAVDLGLLKVSIETAHNTLDLALNPGGFELLQARYQQAAVKLGELEKIGNPPSLRISLQKRSTGAALRDGKKVTF
jgi:hypothetical protein